MLADGHEGMSDEEDAERGRDDDRQDAVGVVAVQGIIGDVGVDHVGVQGRASVEAKEDWTRALDVETCQVSKR